MQGLIKEYRETIKKVRDAKEKANDEDRKTLGSMERDLRYAIEWMRRGHQPGPRRGIERRAAYQREKSFDPLLIQEYFCGLSADDRPSYEYDPYAQIDRPEHSGITAGDRERIEDALSVLTEREREVYLMSRGHCLSFGEIANCLCVGKSTVQDTIERAERKIARRIGESLFCMAWAVNDGIARTTAT